MEICMHLGSPKPCYITFYISLGMFTYGFDGFWGFKIFYAPVMLVLSCMNTANFRFFDEFMPKTILWRDTAEFGKIAMKAKTVKLIFWNKETKNQKSPRQSPSHCPKVFSAQFWGQSAQNCEL